MESIAKNIVIANKFSHLTKDELHIKKKHYYNNNLKRYFYNNKGKIFIIILCILCIILCTILNYPINGDINADTPISKFFSIFGWVSSNLLLALLLTVIGVESFMSREELNQLKFANEEEVKNNINLLKKSPTQEKLNKLVEILKNMFKKNKEKYIHVETTQTPITTSIEIKPYKNGHNEHISKSFNQIADLILLNFNLIKDDKDKFIIAEEIAKIS